MELSQSFAAPEMPSGEERGPKVHVLPLALSTKRNERFEASHETMSFRRHRQIASIIAFHVPAE
jgi:hypothetical protein